MPSQIDYESLIEALAECEESRTPSEELFDSAVLDVKGDLEFLVERLRRPPPEDPFSDESACAAVLNLVAAIGRDPSFVTRQQLESDQAPMDADAGSALPGAGVLGQYRLLTKLGEGGFGAVYQALHSRLDKVVAVKVLSARRLRDPHAVERFAREMRAVGKLHHVNIVAAHDAGEIDGMHYLVMELVDGIDLRELVKQRGRLPIGAACELIRQAAWGLQHAHDHGLVHRDIKPSNLMLTLPPSRDEVPSVKVLDLGLALLEEDHPENFGELTATGQVMGTLEYMAPEQGDDTHDVDTRADIYSLGASLYKLLTAKAPFSSDQYRSPVKLLMALATQEPPPLSNRCPEIIPDLEAIVRRMLSKMPADRFASARELAEALAPFSQPADVRALVDFIATTSAAEPVDVRTPAFVGTQATRSRPGTSPNETASETMTYVAAHPRHPASVWRWASAIAFATCGILIAAAMYVIEVRTSHGTLVIHSDYPGIQVKVKRAGQEVVNGWSLLKGEHNQQLIGTGDIEIELPRELTGEYRVTPDRLTLRKGKQEIVKIERKANSQHTNGDEPKTGSHTRVAVVKPAAPPSTEVIQDRERIAAARERAAAALWQRRNGRGALRMITSGHWVALEPLSELPDQPFHVMQLYGADLNGLKNADLESFTNLAAMERLDLRGPDIDAGAIPYLQRMPSVVNFDLSGTRIPTSALAELRDLPHLQLLGISRPMIDDDLRFLSELKETYRCGVNDYRPTAAGWQQLGQIPHLRCLHFTEENLDPQAVAEFQRGNPACQVMVGNPPRTIGVDPMREAVRQLAARNIGFNIHVSQRISQGLTVQEVLDNPARFYVDTLEFRVPKEHPVINPEVLSPVRAIWWDNLLFRSEGISADEFVAALPDGIRGQHINFADTNLTDRGLLRLSLITRPWTLNIRNTKVTKAGIELYQQARPADTIHSDFGTFRGTFSTDAESKASIPVDRDRAAAELWQRRNGTGLLSGSVTFNPSSKLPDQPFRFVFAWGDTVQGLRNEDLSVFANLGGLMFLEPTGPQIDAGAIPYLKQIPSLIDLDLVGAHIPSSAIAELSSLPHLMNLGVAGKLVDDQWKFLNSLPRLRSLRVNDLAPKSEDWQRLQAVRNLRQLHFVPDTVLYPADVALF